ncbi:hypothetical protein ACSU1N_05090 [Thermogladius sp. 4427co]|uniref:hypothetical protein n=1 Tax=Thermogladius sp. 4427co TaxID=3450718 RepID=UPI003F7AEDD3
MTSIGTVPTIWNGRCLLPWFYDELFSCPLVLLVDSFSIGSLDVFILLPALNYRFIILRKGDRFYEYSNIPSRLEHGHTVEACRLISTGGDVRSIGNPLIKATVYTMFYGGFNIMVKTPENEILPLIIEMVSPRLNIYYMPEASDKNNDLETWVRFGLYLRSGLDSVISGLCGRTIECGGYYILRGNKGDIIVSKSDIRVEGGFRIIVDNSPFRHVVKIRGEGLHEKIL